ncbi:hypothetical protein [Streptomyces sp. NPDC001876]|uniref:hypothetical protein n=1 Tax=unclassified Streptomyces TaxID=2593676 RepID=UPI00332D331B
MLAQEITLTATTTETTALGALMVEPEAAVSDAPLYTPEAAGFLLALLLLSPKEPKEPRGK